MMGDFDGTVPLYAGVLRGIRHWNVDAQGRLTAVSNKAVWRPGLNTATCEHRRSPGARFGETNFGGFRLERIFVAVRRDEPLRPGTQIRESWLSEDDFYRLSPEERAEYVLGWEYCWVKGPEAEWRSQVLDEDDHQIPKLGCGCGFWAYFRREDSHNVGGLVQGIVEAQGRIIAGTLGFRAEKARIVALVDPTMPQEPGRMTVRSAAAALAAVFGSKVMGSIFGIWIAVGGALGFRLAHAALGSARDSGALSGEVFVWGVFGLAFAATVILREVRHRQLQRAGRGRPGSLGPADFERLRRNYPAGKFYRTIEEAVLHHKVEVPATPGAGGAAMHRPDVSSHDIKLTAQSVFILAVVGCLGFWGVQAYRTSGPGTPWDLSGSIRASVSCNGELSYMGDIEGDVTITLRNIGSEKVEGKARAVVVAGDSHIYRSIRSTLAPGQTGTFAFGYRMLAVNTDKVICQNDIPEERPAGNEDKDPEDGLTCWGDPRTGEISVTYDDTGSNPRCDPPSVP